MKYDFYDNEMITNFMPYNDVNNNFQKNNNLDLFNPYEGFLSGNAFKNQYVPYKNYKPYKVKITNEKEEMLFNIDEYSFMAHELNLYLDTNPNDRDALDKFLEYRNKANELINMYERKYGPININGNINNQVPFEWLKDWPWVN